MIKLVTDRNCDAKFEAAFIWLSGFDCFICSVNYPQFMLKDCKLLSVAMSVKTAVERSDLSVRCCH